jgi:NitT/TauT family transport system substrate-binding protein
VGYFPSILHAQALIGLARQDFQRQLGAETIVVPKLFHSGPSAIEALFAGEIDLSYVGPSPAITGFVRSQGQALRVIAGAASGGAVFVRREGITIGRSPDYVGKRFAAPQIGNTQDISLRIHLAGMGFLSRDRGGSVEVLALPSPDILTLFLRGEIDAAWVPEPWGAILIDKAHASLVIDERDLWPGRKFPAALLVASKRVLDENPQNVRQFLKAHLSVTHWIQQNPESAKQLLNQQLAAITRKPLPEKTLNEAFGRFEVTFEAMPLLLETFFQRARQLNYIKRGEIKGLCDLHLLNELLEQKNVKELIASSGGQD